MTTNPDPQSRGETPPSPPAPRNGIDTIALLTLGGLVAVGVMAVTNWREIDNIEAILGARLERLEGRVAQMVENDAGAPVQQARRGPDPSRVYQINTSEAPVKGKSSAPITIAEFSDFQ